MAYARFLDDLEQLQQNEYGTAYLRAAGHSSFEETIKQLGYAAERVTALLAECKADIAEEQQERAKREPSRNDDEDDIPC